jgi:hypothetical protein
MASNSLEFEDRLDGALNLLSWKVGITLLLEENDHWDLVKDVATLPYKSTTVDSSQQEGSEGQADDVGCQ